jgi:hypothetical protein
MKLEFSKGQQVLVTVIEVQAGNDLLVSHRGKLFLVHNDSGRRFVVNEKIHLFVSSLSPLVLAFERKSKLDVSV